MTETTSDTPLISVALLTRNAGPLLDRVLDGIGMQETDRAVEIVAMDSGSDDGTVERLEKAGARVESINPKDFNFGATRDFLYTLTQGEFVVNLSQDAVPSDAHWLEHLIAPLLNDEKVAVSCGRSVPDPDRGFAQFPWEKNGYFYYTREMRRFREQYGHGVSFANSAVRRSAWEQIRFQPIVLGEDFQFQVALHETNWTTAFPDDAAVLHHHDYTLATLRRRCRDEGTALAQLGCTYSAGDCLADLVHPRKNMQWLRDAVSGRLRSPAAWLFPVVRPVEVRRGDLTFLFGKKEK